MMTRNNPELRLNHNKVVDMKPRLKERLLIDISELDHDIALLEYKVKLMRQEREKLVSKLLIYYGEARPLPVFTSKHFEEEGYEFED